MAAIPSGTPFIEDFESIPATDAIDTDSIVTPTITVSGPAGAPPDLGVFETPTSGSHAKDGSRFIIYSGAPLEMVTFTLPTTTRAFGVWITDAYDGVSDELSFGTPETGDDASVVIGPKADADEFFFGAITDDPFTSPVFLMGALADADGFGFDRVISTTSVPEPSTYFLLSTVLVVSFFMQRQGRRKKHGSSGC